MMMAINKSITKTQIEKIKVENLFNTFNHEIVLNSQSPLTILLGQNGVGKTALLLLVNALFSYQFETLLSYPYSSLSLSFRGGSTLTVSRIEEEFNASDGEIIMRVPGGGVERIKISEIWKNRRMNRHPDMERYSRFRPGIWYDNNTGELVTSEEVMINRVRKSDVDVHGCPLWLTNIIESTVVRLIDTKRLQTRPSDSSRSGNVQDTITECENDFKDRLVSIKASAGSIASELDRTFPRRLLAVLSEGGDMLGESKGRQTVDRFRENLEALERKRRKLDGVGLMEVVKDVAIPRRMVLSDDLLKVLDMYLDDSNKKVDAYSEMSERIALFVELINARFLKKTLSVDGRGFVLRSAVSEEEIPLSKLSSGEQHLFILYYNMLFKFQEGTLLLLDEPEISLNISWQKSLVNDMHKIMSINPINILMATHSPSIVRAHWAQTIELKG